MKIALVLGAMALALSSCAVAPAFAKKAKSLPPIEPPPYELRGIDPSLPPIIRELSYPPCSKNHRDEFNDCRIRKDT